MIEFPVESKLQKQSNNIIKVIFANIMTRYINLLEIKSIKNMGILHIHAGFYQIDIKNITKYLFKSTDVQYSILIC